MRKLAKSIVGLVCMLTATLARAQSGVEMADGMRAEGKIYVVVAIILIILTGFVVYLVVLDRKVKKLADLLAEKNSSDK